MCARLTSRDDIELITDLNFREALIVNGKVFCREVCLNDLDRFFWFCELKNEPGNFDVKVLKTLARDTKVVSDPNAFEIGQDKYSAHLTLRDAGVDVPDFVMFDYRFPVKMADVLNEWGKALLKPRWGGWGKGITLIESPKQLENILGYVQSATHRSMEHGFFLERFFPNDPNKWASTTFINGQLTLGYRKVETKFQDLGDGIKKVQDMQEKGGGVVLADLDPRHIEMAHKAYDAIGLEIIGFDMIWTENGPLIIDENTYPGNYL